jgi:shikimate dehydrogenase
MGFNTDFAALRPDLLPFTREAVLFETPVVLFGAGGAARAVLQVLTEEKDVEVALYNRDVAKGAALLAEFGVAGEARPLGAVLPQATLIVNASSLGMTGFPPLPADLSNQSSALVYDLVYDPIETDLLRRARARGLATLDGLHMLLGQARLAFTHFFSFSPPAGTENELRELLTR